jgi:hypothetical protein
MPFIVEILTGPAAGRKFDVPDGAAAAFGRNEKSRFVIPDDIHLSGAHFSIECRGEKCKVRDLSSTNGTFVNGAKIAEAEIGLHDVISAGSCTFQLRPGAAEEWTGFPPRQKAILSLLYGYGLPVYVVLDAAREDRLPAFLQAYGVEHASLYEGENGDRLKDVAPYLALLPKTSQLLKLLMNEGWGKGWGVFFNSDVPFAGVMKHLRRFLTVQNEEGQSLYFRFYDPRVLRTFLPTCTPEESADFFGPISRFVAEGDDLAQPLQFKGSPLLARTRLDRQAIQD